MHRERVLHPIATHRHIAKENNMLKITDNDGFAYEFDARSWEVGEAGNLWVYDAEGAHLATFHATSWRRVVLQTAEVAK